MNREAHDATMGRVTTEKAPSNGSWWVGHGRDGWAQRCEREFLRMRHTRFGSMVALNYATEVVEPRRTEQREFAS